MEISELKKWPDIEPDSKLANKQSQLEQLLTELRNKNLHGSAVIQINQQIKELNSISAEGKTLEKKFEKVQTEILKIIEEELQLVPKNHYRNMWLAIGTAAFGIPIGLLYGVALDNYGFMGIGIPIGLAIGLGIGNVKDKKAGEEGKQLEFENQ